MAGKKKQAQLTPEEKLQQALVPEDEQPYKVPANWCWTKLGNVCRFESGFAFKSDYFNKVNGIPVVRISDIKENEVILHNCIFTTELNIDEKFIIRNGDLLIAMSGATTGKNGIFKSDKIAYLNQRVGNIKVINNNVIKELYRNYYIMNKSEEILKAAYGGAQPNISSSKISSMFFPLPPLAEQQRIVERIESLFAKLDEAKENLQNVLDGFETRKAAILHKAFTGELTANWRKQHGVSMDSWEEKALQEVCSSIYDGDHMPPPKSETGIPFLVISNVNTGYLSFENTRFVPEEYYNSLNMVRKPCKGDVLYTLVGSYGISVIVDTDRNFCFQRHMALLKPKNIDTRYLWYTLQTQQTYEKATKIATGTAQLTVPIKGLRQMEIYVPTLQEQTEIVRIIDGLLAKEQQAKELAENVLDKIELIKKSILARAFRGELGTNNLADEPAVELLKRML